MKTKGEKRRAESGVRTAGGYGIGRTIAEEREKLETESERIAAREKAKKRQTRSVVVLVIGLVAIGVLIAIGVKSLAEGSIETTMTQTEKFEPSENVEIIDESGAGISGRTKEYIGALEQDFKDLGYTLTRVAIPAGKRREIDAYVENTPYYFKMNLDRGTAVSAEDADRMIRYLADAGITPGYVDLRVEGKAYYQ